MRLSKDVFGKLFVILWAVVVAIVISFQMAGHLLAMPLPSEIEIIRQSLIKYQKNNEWVYAHVISEKCSCTNLLLEHLIKRGPMVGATEVVILIGESSQYEVDLRAAGYEFYKTNKEHVVMELGIDAVPVFAVLDGREDLQYLGGYFASSAAKYPKDESIISELSAGKEVMGFPLYGCAVSDTLKNYIDPLGVSEI